MFVAAIEPLAVILIATPIVSALLGLAPTPKWTILFGIVVAIGYGIAMSAGVQPDDMPGAAVFFAFAHGTVSTAAWLVARGLREFGRAVRKKAQQTSPAPQ